MMVNLKIIKEKDMENIFGKMVIYYIGQWLNGKKHGKGILYYKDGTIKYGGNFKNDEYAPSSSSSSISSFISSSISF